MRAKNIRDFDLLLCLCVVSHGEIFHSSTAETRVCLWPRESNSSGSSQSVFEEVVVTLKIDQNILNSFRYTLCVARETLLVACHKRRGKRRFRAHISYLFCMCNVNRNEIMSLEDDVE